MTDLSVYESINGWAARHDTAEDVLRVFALYSPEMFVGLAVILFFARGSWATRAGRRGAVAAAFSAGLALLLAHFISAGLDRTRPFLAHPRVAHLFIPAAHDPTFPSDHATGAFAIAVAILLRHRPAGLLALAVAVVVAFSRVACGAHYPTDVIAGALLGSACALVLWVPPVRRVLDGIADRAGAAYDGATRRLLPA